MKTPDSLATHIAEFLAQKATHVALSRIASEMGGFVIPSASEGSKRDRVLEALKGKSARQLGEIAQKLGASLDSFELEEEGFAVLEEGELRISEITRRDVARCFGEDLAGERDLLALLREHFPIDAFRSDFLDGFSLADAVHRHMVRNPGDWNVEYLFEQIGALHCSRHRFARLIESAVHPLAIRGPAQFAVVQRLNIVLGRDGYSLKRDGEESRHPLYRLQSLARGVSGAPKNLIFASSGPKPEIGLSDAINSDIVILSNAESCLVYDRPLSRDGLLWSELVDWWSAKNPSVRIEAARSLAERLAVALASDAERMLFETYFRLYRPSLAESLPALIPQVYLHYDPAIVKRITHRAALPRQRMDFLLLLPNSQRVVIEVDGVHHFSDLGKPSLASYSKMVSADRDLRLAGYEVFRFGANELVGSGATEVIRGFFDKLWELHRLTS